MKSSLQRILKAVGKQTTLVDSASINTYVKTHYASLLSQIQKQRDEEKGKFVKGYMKSELEFYGIKLPAIHQMISESISKSEDFQKNFLLSQELMKSNIFQLKIGGIDILGMCHAGINKEVLGIVKEIILDGHIQGWGLCDSLALPLKQASLRGGEEFDDCLVDWKYQKQNTWVRRTALVSFVKKARHGDNKPNYKGFLDKLFGMCEQCVQYQNRFNQLGVGWLLREMSVPEKGRVSEFIIKHYDTMSREGIRYAIEKMEPEERQKMLKYKKGDSVEGEGESVGRPRTRSKGK